MKPKNIKFAALGIESVMIRADPDKVRQILNNLIGNALKFIDTGGVKISARIEKNRLKIYTP